ncbi:MAG: protease Do, partial [Opitutus sp.]|nr:protease Do [Opitutus sp.]
VIRGYLGVSSETLTPDIAESFNLPRDTRGVVITDLSPADGPAAKAGIKREDIVTGVNGRPVGTRDDLRLIIAQILPGTKVSVQLLRDGKPRTVEVALGKLEDDVAAGEFLPGVNVEALTSELRRQFRIDPRVEGVVITEIADNSPYQGVFPVGCVLEQINRVPVTDAATARNALRSGRNMALIHIRGIYRYVLFEVR